MNFQYHYRKYSQALYFALQEDPFYATMESSVANGSSKEALMRYLDYSIAEGKEYGRIYTPNGHDYGISVWLIPQTADKEEEKKTKKRKFLIDHMGRQSLEVYSSIVDYMSEKSCNLVDHNSWYLSIIGIHPEAQGRGLGGDLVLDALQKTDQMGVSTYLETFSKRNVAFYKRLGYEEIACIDEPITRSAYSILMRTCKR